MNTYIYALIDPKTKDIRYIGKADNIKVRYKGHLKKSSLRAHTHKNYWLKSLISSNLLPEIKIIATVKEVSWKYWEIYYINYYKSIGCSLTNTAEGGEGNTVTTDHPRYYEIQKSKGRKGRISEKKGIPLSKEHRDKIKNHKYPKRCKQPKYVIDKIRETKKIRYSLGLYDFYGEKNSNATKVVQYSKTNVLIKHWDCIKSASSYTNICSTAIGKCCAGKSRTSGGFIWKYGKSIEYNSELVPLFLLL